VCERESESRCVYVTESVSRCTTTNERNVWVCVCVCVCVRVVCVYVYICMHMHVPIPTHIYTEFTEILWMDFEPFAPGIHTHNHAHTHTYVYV